MKGKSDKDGLDAVLKGLRREEASPDALLRARQAATAVLESDRAQPDVMTLDEVADYLRVSRDELETIADELPAFELAGRIRVRREALNAWVKQRERGFRQTADASWANEYKALHIERGVA